MESSAAVPWEIFLLGYLSGNSDFTSLYSAAYKPFLGIVARIARFMPEDIREEVVNQAFVRLMENPPKYDPSKCKPRTFAYGLLRNAVKQVRAMYAQPGRKTRTVPELVADGKEQTAGPLEADQAIAEDSSIADDLEAVPTTRWSPASIEARAEARLVLGQLPRELAAAAWIVYGLEFSIVETARAMKKSRFAVARCLKQARRAA